MPPSARPDPVLEHARREAWIILVIWLVVTLFCCLYCYGFGYNGPDYQRGAGDLRPVLGIPRWFFFGVVVPWAVSGLVSLVFAAFVVADDDLGSDHAPELEADIRLEPGGPGDV